MPKRNENLMFFVQPGDSAFTDPERTMKTYLNRFMISEDDQVKNKCRLTSTFNSHK